MSTGLKGQSKRREGRDRLGIVDTALLAAAIVLLCALVAVSVIYRKALRGVFRLLLRAAVGVAVITAVNYALPLFGFAPPVGVNALSVGVSAVLGLPGLAMLYALAVI